ncbi:MAG: AtpZ/AtpI family protein [Sphingobacteriia bacterium]|nr:AtpZ/AtpI family protein [Sphingobacteriia bacterium]
MENKDKQPLKDYARYSSLGFQMLAIILLMTFLGIKADRWLTLKFPIFTVVGSLAGVGMALYFAIKDLLKK